MLGMIDEMGIAYTCHKWYCFCSQGRSFSESSSPHGLFNESDLAIFNLELSNEMDEENGIPYIQCETVEKVPIFKTVMQPLLAMRKNN